MRPTPSLRARLRVVQPTRGNKFPLEHYDNPQVPVRADWHPLNIHNLYQRNNGALKSQGDFSKSRDSLYKIFGSCKQLLRDYWMPAMKDRYFRRWYLPSSLPVIQATALSSPTVIPTSKSITRWTRPGKEGGRAADEAAELHSYLGSQAPTMPLMFREIERRLDHVVFRGGFADSLEGARGIIGEGAVRLNGNVERQRQVRLLPGDFLEINPAAVSFLGRPPQAHVALADSSSKGLEYDRRAGLSRLLVELVGLTPDQAQRAIADDGLEWDEGSGKFEVAAKENVGERGFDKARLCYERWLAVGGKFYGRDMAPPLSQEVIRSILGEEPTVDGLRDDEEAGLTLRERRAKRERALLSPEEQAKLPPSTAGDEAGALYLTDADEPALVARSGASKLPTKSNAGVRLTPAHFPALPSDPSGTIDFHLPPFCAPQLFVPAYLQPNYRFCTLTYLRHPTARHNMCELPSPFDAKGAIMRRAWEWYKARKMRVKSYAGGLYPGGTDARARRAYARRGPELGRTGVHEDFY